MKMNFILMSVVLVCGGLIGCSGGSSSSDPSLPSPTSGADSELMRKVKDGSASLKDWTLADTAARMAFTMDFTQKRLGTADEKKAEEITRYLDSYISKMRQGMKPPMVEAILKASLDTTTRAGVRLMGWPDETPTPQQTQ